MSGHACGVGFVLPMLFYSLVSHGNYAPPRHVQGLIGAGDVEVKGEGIRVEKVETSVRVYPLYTRTMSRIWAVAPFPVEASVSMRFVDGKAENALSDRRQAEMDRGILRAEVALDERTATLTGCAPCDIATPRALIKRERGAFKRGFPTMWPIWKDIFEGEVGPSKKTDDYRCCVRGARISLDAGMNRIESDTVTANSAYYLATEAHRLRGYGYFAATLLLDAPDDSTVDPPAQMTVAVRMVGHPECGAGAERCPTLNALPPPHETDGKRLTWRYSNAWRTEPIHVNARFEITGYDKGISNDFGLGVAESLLGRRLLEGEASVVVSPESVERVEASGELKNRTATAAFDGDLVSTAWESNPRPGDEGFGTLTAVFAAPTRIAAVGIVPGRWERPIHYIGSGRPKTMTAFADGNPIANLSLVDRRWSIFSLPLSMQVFPLPSPVTAKEIALRIDSVYPGKKQKRGAAVGEVVFFRETPKSPLEEDFPFEPPTHAPAVTPTAPSALKVDEKPSPSVSPNPEPPDPSPASSCGCSVSGPRRSFVQLIWTLPSWDTYWQNSFSALKGLGGILSF